MTLDERVATALGWVEDVTYGWYPGGEEALASRVWHMTGKKTETPDFSVNWNRVPEMLNWLQARCFVRVEFFASGWTNATALALLDMARMESCRGSSLPDALAKLIVGVSEEEGLAKAEKP